MTEKFMNQKLREELEPVGVLWNAPKVRFRSTDILTLFDFVYVHNTGKVYFIQITTLQHKAERAEKIRSYFQRSGCAIPKNCWIYCWDENAAEFRKFPIR